MTSRLMSDEPLDHSVDAPYIPVRGVPPEPPVTGGLVDDHPMDRFDVPRPVEPTDEEIVNLGAGMPEFSIFWKGDRDPHQARREYLAEQRRSWAGRAAEGTVTTLDDIEGKVARVLVCSACQRKDRVLDGLGRCAFGCDS